MSAPRRRRRKRTGPTQWVVTFNRYNRGGPILNQCLVETDGGRLEALRQARERFPIMAKDGSIMIYAKIYR